MKNNKKEIKKKDLIILIVILILTVISLIIYSKEVYENKEPKLIEKPDYAKISGEDEIEQEEKKTVIPQTEEELKSYLSTLKERDRIEYYCGEYFSCLDSQDYKGAYNLLYDEFKAKYFPTLEEYEDYIKKTYPENMAFKYEDISRQENIYVLEIVIVDLLGSKDSEKPQRILVKENDYNDFKISFQVL